MFNAEQATSSTLWAKVAQKMTKVIALMIKNHSNWKHFWLESQEGCANVLSYVNFKFSFDLNKLFISIPFKESLKGTSVKSRVKSYIANYIPNDVSFPKASPYFIIKFISCFTIVMFPRFLKYKFNIGIKKSFQTPIL